MNPRKKWYQKVFPSTLTLNQQERTYTSLTDDELCRLYRESFDLEIIMTLLDRYERYVISITLPYNRHLDSVADFKNELFLHLHKVLKHSEPNNFKHWLGRIAKNKIRDIAKKHKPEIREELPDSQNDFADDWNLEIDFDAVRQVVQQLRPDQRLYIELAFFEEYKSREIQESLGWSADKARKVRQNAMRNLRKKLGGIQSDFSDYLKSA